MAEPLIIAYGNSLRGDDGVAFAVLDRITERAAVPFQSMREPQLDLEFSDDISRSSLVVFVDAAIVGEPGQAEMTWVTAREDEVARSHECTPGALLAYTRAIHGHAPRAALVTVTGQNFDFSESLSAAVESGVPVAADMIGVLLETNVAETAD